MRPRITAILTCLLLAPASGCQDDCDCLPDRTVLSFTLTEGEFADGTYAIELMVDGELRATCTSTFADTSQDLVSCDDAAIQVSQVRTVIAAELPEYEEGAAVSLEVRDEQSGVWTGSVIVEAQGYGTSSCACWQGQGQGQLAPSAGG